jgi:hypothetical protein
MDRHRRQHRSKSWQCFQSSAASGESQAVRIILKPDGNHRGWLSDQIRNTTTRLSGRGDLRDNASQFNVKGFNVETERIEELDILKDLLVSSKQIIRIDETSRAVNPADAYRAVEEAYEELRADLVRAAAVEIS